MPDNYTQLKERFINARARRAVLTTERDQLQSKIETLQTRHQAARTAQAVIQQVAERTQQQLQYNISSIVTTALAAVFDDPEQFKIKFVQRRGRTECDILFVKGEQEMDPIGFTGGGVLDVTCFALRVAFLCLRPDTRRVLFLDEPFRNLHGQQEQERCSAMVKMMSDRLGIQINMISDVETINSVADKVFTCSLNNGITVVT